MISCVIICKNEAHNIARAINSAFRVADEVIVVDAQSEDDTQEVVRKTKARLIVRPWEGYGQTKNFGVLNCENDWILSLDADEEMDERLVQSIRDVQLDSSKAYLFRIVMSYLGKTLRFTEYAPHWKPRLFHRSYYKWDTREVHEKLIAIDHDKREKLDGMLLHFSFKDLAHHKDKIDRYARLSAKELIRNAKNPSWIKRVFGPNYRWFRSYILRMGILEGRNGLIISNLARELVIKRYKYFDEFKADDKLS